MTEVKRLVHSICQSRAQIVQMCGKLPMSAHFQWTSHCLHDFTPIFAAQLKARAHTRTHKCTHVYTHIYIRNNALTQAPICYLYYTDNVTKQEGSFHNHAFFSCFFQVRRKHVSRWAVWICRLLHLVWVVPLSQLCVECWWVTVTVWGIRLTYWCFCVRINSPIRHRVLVITLWFILSSYPYFLRWT